MSDHRLPPGPRTPVLLNGLAFLFAQRPTVRLLQRRYGDAFTLVLPTMGRAVFFNTPAYVKAVYTAKPDVLHAGENPLGDFFGPGSLFSMDEEQHLKERRRLLPPFHGDRMKSYDALIEEEAVRALDAWPEGREFASLPTFNAITLRVILRAVFGAEGAQLTELERMIPPMTRLGQKIVAVPALGRDLGRFSIGGRYLPMRARFDQIVGDLVQRRLDDPALEDRIDILSLMLRSLLEEGGTIDRAHVADELVTLLMAGHETTASSLAFAMDLLRRHPHVLRRLEEEAAGDRSTYRLATINEVQRIRPVIGGTGRRVHRPFDIGPWRLPVGTAVITAGAAIHDDDRFHPDATRFDPDRYVGRKPDTYAWIPFGGGVRRCIGASFAVMEMDVVLRTLLRRFELLPTRARSERMRFRGVANAPARGGLVAVRRRRMPLGDDLAVTAAACPMHAATA